MDIRYSANQKDFQRYNTQELRQEFMVESLFVDNDVTAVYSHVDRLVVMGAKPVNKTLKIDQNMDVWKTFGAKYFLELRELGIINVGGGAGTVTVDGTDYTLNKIEALYVARGSKDISFTAVDEKNPPKFYMISYPAHRACTTTYIPFEKAKHLNMGADETANKRVIHQLIHPDVVETCQLCMGCTMLEPGSVWNTMPSHTHERRMEVYMYFDIPAENVVFHYMGEPQETRHLVMQNDQATISPSWSIHSGCGTSNYSFIWGMGGENKVFDDMDHIKNTELR